MFVNFAIAVRTSYLMRLFSPFTY